MKAHAPKKRTFEEVKAHNLDVILRQIGYPEFVAIWGQCDKTKEIYRYAEDLAERQASVFVANQALAPWNNVNQSNQPIPTTFSIRRI